MQNRAEISRPRSRSLIFKGRSQGNWNAALLGGSNRITREESIVLHRWENESLPVGPTLMVALLNYNTHSVIHRLDVFTDTSHGVIDTLWNTRSLYDFMLTPQGVEFLVTEFPEWLRGAEVSEFIGADLDSLLAIANGDLQLSQPT